jgi:hypothetical protein
LTACNSSNLKLLSTLPKTHSISTKFESGISGAIFGITNVYGPNLEEVRPSFFEELNNLRDHIHHPWLIAGDFNLVHTPLERSSLHMTINENLFNDLIWDLSLQEIPLLDQEFTWCNMQPPPPLLSKLDRVLINSKWNDSFPNSSVHTLPRTTPDHFPLKIEISTNIPKSQIFCYCINWPLKPSFKELVSSSCSNTPLNLMP